MALVTGQTKEAFDRDEMARKGPLDHGVLNIPLSKRGDIDKDIDRYKADKAKQDKAEAKETAVKRKTDKQEAKEMLAEHQEAMRALGPLPLAGTDQDLAVLLALGAMKLVNRHGDRIAAR